MYYNIINRYLRSELPQPFFLVVGDNAYLEILENLKHLDLNIVKLSSFCNDQDKFPDIDAFLEFIGEKNNSLKNKRLAIIGLGELLELKGEKEAKRYLSYIKEVNLKDKKAIFIMRGVLPHIKDLQNDVRFDERHVFIDESITINFSITIVNDCYGLPVEKGIKSLLIALENGATGNIFIKSDMSFENSLRNVYKINSAYEVIMNILPDFKIPFDCGIETMWNEFLKELSENDNSTKQIFVNHGFSLDFYQSFYNKIAGNDYNSWLYFIFLKMQANSITNNYLQFVLQNTLKFEDFKQKVLSGIGKLSIENRLFKKHYNERKELISSFPESDIAFFVMENRKDYKSSIFRLTDKTITEKQEIISWVSKHGVISEIKDIYPALYYYLNKYIFNCGELSELLTDYFYKYKQQKISNSIEESFLNKVNELAISRLYNRLTSRDEIIEKLKNDATYLIWVDALGVEYLSYITRLAKLKNLSMNVKISKSELPTLTSFNKSFYDNWGSNFKEKINDLDEVKHKAKGGYNFTENKLPIHLAQELEIIEKVINKIATKLSTNKYKRILVVSDHGASRLAVLRKKEEKYDTETKGQHSGRCCKYFENYELPFAAEENGYLILADYGRFKGSRAANVEVHGGASLEEVVIPIIEFSLQKHRLKIELNSDDIIVDFRKGTKISFFSNRPLENVSISFLGNHYIATEKNKQHYEVILSDMKKSGNYLIEVFSGDNFIKEFSINAKSKIGHDNKDFDDLF